MPTSMKEMNREKFELKIDKYYSELSSFFVLIKENKTAEVEKQLVKRNLVEGKLVEEKLVKGKFHVDCYDHDYTTPLFIAVKHGHFKMVKLLVEKYDAKINEGNLLGITPLLVACANGYVHIVDYLFRKMLEKDEELVLQSHMQITPMGMACAHGQLDVVKYLLELKIDNSMKPIKNTISPSPIMLAAMNNHSNIIKFFFLPNIKRNNLYCSTLNDEERRSLDENIEEAEQKLKKYNVNLDIDETVPEFFELNLLSLSLNIRNVQMVDLLITFCADQNLDLKFSNGSTMRNLIRKYKTFVGEEKNEKNVNVSLNSSTVSTSTSNSEDIKKKSNKLKFDKKIYNKFFIK